MRAEIQSPCEMLQARHRDRRLEVQVRRCSGWQSVRRLGIGVLAIGTMAWAGCGVTDQQELPSGVQDPATVQTPSGAVSYYRAVLTKFLPTMLENAWYSGAIMTDEFTALPVALGEFGKLTEADIRQGFNSLSNSGSQSLSNSAVLSPYPSLHLTRAEASEARGFLQTYAPDSSPALKGHLYALEAYAEIYLADLFCSGIPLSTVDFGGDYTLAAGSSTADVYAHAVELFDSALRLVNDSVRFQQLAAVGRARALLALGRYADAATEVAAVPDNFAYKVAPPPKASRFLNMKPSPNSLFDIGFQSMSDGEGINGLNYRSSGDPRTTAQLVVTKDSRGNPVYAPKKYTPTDGSFTYTVASGVEARLIEAEAALRARDTVTWRAKLNHLRQTAWTTIVPAISSPLDTLADPGPDSNGGDGLRVNLLFRERAFWLYVTGHRQGDLRRLIREYQRTPSTVYPTGFYLGGNGGYGQDVVIPVPESEQVSNPNYSGCMHRNA